MGKLVKKRLLAKALIISGLILLPGCEQGALKEEYAVARDPTWFPRESIAQNKGVLPFSDDLLRAVGQDEGFRVELFSGNWNNLLQLLEKQEVAAVLTSLTPLPIYRDLYTFSDIYLYVGPVLVVPTASPASSLEQMEGKTIAVLSGSPTQLLAARVPQVVIKQYPQMARALEDLAGGAVDGVLIDALTAYAYVRDLYHGVLRVATPPLTDDGLRLVVLRGKNQRLITAFNAGLKKLIDDGTYDVLQKKWGLDLDQGPMRLPVSSHNERG